MSKKFVVDEEYQGYVFCGYAMGQFEPRDAEPGAEKRPYYNMYVLGPVSSYQSDDYQAYGFKAEKKRCISPDVWKDLDIGCRVRLLFDDKQRVVMAALDQ